MIPQPLRLTPQYRDYLWGGGRLRPQIVPTAEAWVVYENNLVASGPYAGRSLTSLVSEFGGQLLGQRAGYQGGSRFPLLIKLLDCAQWLSLQVHPDDEQAVALEGAGFFGKTEAWQILEADPNSKLIAGIKPGVNAAVLAASIRDQTILERVETLPVQAGDTLFMSPGTIHALGPGLLVYEIQQTSDLTYRVYDWGRPQTENRKLHIDKALAVSRPDATASVLPAPDPGDGEARLLSQCRYFTLELINSMEKPVALDTRAESFHALTVIEGQVQIVAGAESQLLDRFETVLIPAICGPYRIEPMQASRVLKAGL